MHLINVTHHAGAIYSMIVLLVPIVFVHSFISRGLSYAHG
jgi:hypothetical protein